MIGLPDWASLANVGDGAWTGGWGEGQRAHTLEADGTLSHPEALEGLIVERFAVSDTISEGFVMELHVLSTEMDQPVHLLVDEAVGLNTRLADGSIHVRRGVVTDVQRLRSDGGFTRFRLLVEPWVSQLALETHSRVWQDKSVVEILDDVFGAYLPYANWQWGEEGESLSEYLVQGPHEGVHPFCVQYRESDWAFMQRMLAQAGLSWRVEAVDEDSGKIGHRIVIFASSSLVPQDATSESSAGGDGIRFARADGPEHQDSIQALAAVRRLKPQETVTLAWDPLAKKAVAAQARASVNGTSSTLADELGPWIQNYSVTDALQSGDPLTLGALEHLAAQSQLALDGRSKTWAGMSCVRSFDAGRWFSVTEFAQAGAEPDEPQEALDARRQFVVLNVRSLSLNNLPKNSDAGTEPFTHPLLQWINTDAELLELAKTVGHGNRLEAIRRTVPWKPLAVRGLAALGPQSAVVVGAGGATLPDGLNEVYTDAQGRVKVRFHWQDELFDETRPDNANTCWVRVCRRLAGPGVGLQRLPRVGDEVIVDFIGGRADIPMVVGSVYSGQGEGGIPPTPGGVNAEPNLDPLKSSSDHLFSAQGNLSIKGRAPAWHGGAPMAADADVPGQNNAAAMSGFKSKEWGALGFNQLVWDDTPQQIRTQLATTLQGTQLNMGHLLHQADNHRGSFRGLGFELRTDAGGAMRAKQGVLLTTYSGQVTQGTPSSPAFDNAAGMALMKHAVNLSTKFNEAAEANQATPLSSAKGSHQGGSCLLSDKEPPLKALSTAINGMASERDLGCAQQDARERTTAATDHMLPHATDPIVAISAKAGVSVLAGQSLQIVSQDVVVQQAGGDVQWGAGSQMRWVSGQSIGVLAGAMQPGSNGAAASGLTLLSAKGAVLIQAQAGAMQVAARKDIRIQSVKSNVDFEAATRVTITTGAGSQIVIDATGVHNKCSGSFTVHAASRKMAAGQDIHANLPILPKGQPGEYHRRVQLHWENTNEPAKFQRYEIHFRNGRVIKGVTDGSGYTEKFESPALEPYKLYFMDI